MGAEIFDMKLYKKALRLAKKGKSLKSKPASCVVYEVEKQGVTATEELKQKAEEYCNTKLLFTFETDLVQKIARMYAKQAYTAGATENGIQWHDLRKDPNDLPKKNKSYWVYIDCHGNKIYRSIVWQGHWLGWDCIPLAWCEEPQFKE